MATTRPRKLKKTPRAIQTGFPGIGACNKAYETCRKCNGRKVLPYGAPGERTHVGCSECGGEGIALYPVHEMRKTSETCDDGLTMRLYTETWQCAHCPHAEKRTRTEKK